MSENHFSFSWGSWSQIVESRLLGVVREEDRQYAFQAFLQHLRSSVRALIPDSDSNLYEAPISISIYEIHNMRTRSLKTKSPLVDLTTSHEDETTIIKKINGLLQLLDWLVKSFWSNSFSKTPLQGQWVTILMETMSLIHEFKSLNLSDGKLEDTVSEISSTLKGCLSGEEELSASRKVAGNSTGHGDVQTRTLTDMMYCVDERLEGYDEMFNETITDPSHRKDPHWLPFLERNKDLLLNGSNLQILVSGAQEPQDLRETTSPKLLKLPLECLSQLPLPLFLDIHEWLWSTPDRMRLYMETACGDYDLSLNQTFNKLTNADIPKLAVQIGCLILQRPVSTLERVLQHITQNQESVSTLCQVLQCLPQLRGTEFLFEAVSKYLQSERWSKPEENNLLNFTVRLCQNSIFPYDLALPAGEPPMLSYRELLVKCVLPSLFTEGIRPVLAIPIDRSLRLTNGLLKTTVWPASLLHTTVICLCELLERIRTDVLTGHRITTRELVLEGLEGVCTRIPSACSDDNKNLPVLLWVNLKDFHWSIKLKIADYLQDLAPCYQQYHCDQLDAILVLLQSLAYSKDDIQEEDELAAWGTIITASSVSRSTAEMCRQMICDSFTYGTYPLSDQSLVMSLAVYLPTCTVNEWKNTMEAIGALFGTVLTTAYSSHFTSYLLLEMDDIFDELLVSQLLSAVLEVISGDWDNTLKCYMATMQDVLNRNKEGRGDAHSKLFLAGQVFCHACSAMQLVPAEHDQETLIILGCEVLGQIEELDRSKVMWWKYIQRDMLEAADGHEALVKKIRDLG